MSFGLWGQRWSSCALTACLRRRLNRLMIVGSEADSNPRLVIAQSQEDERSALTASSLSMTWWHWLPGHTKRRFVRSGICKWVPWIPDTSEQKRRKEKTDGSRAHVYMSERRWLDQIERGNGVYISLAFYFFTNVSSVDGHVFLWKLSTTLPYI